METEKTPGFLAGLVHEFKEFALKGNAIDLAIGVVIGAAFGSIVTSLVNDVLMPPIGLITGGVDFSKKWIVLHQAVYALGKDGKTWEVIKPENDLRYGIFLNNVINFLIVALAIFAVIKMMNMMKRKKPAAAGAPAAPPELTTEEKLLVEIRDAIKAKTI